MEARAPLGGDRWATQELTGFLALFASLADEREVTPRMVERAAATLGAEGAALIDADRVVAATGPATEVLGSSQLREVADGERSTLALAGRGDAQAVAVPVTEDGGALVIARTGEPFAREELDLLRGMGRVMGLGLRVLRLIESERERQALLERLSAIQRSIAGQRTLHEIFDQVVEYACELTGDGAGILQLLDPDAGPTPTVVASLGVSPAFLSAHRRADERGLGARAIAAGEPVVVDGKADPEGMAVPGGWRNEGLRAGIAAPVFQRGEIAGSLTIASHEPDRTYTPRDRQMVLAFAEHAGLALNHARALDDLAHHSFHDPLTGMPNRALFLDRVSHSLAGTERSGTQVGVLFIDLDDFKTVNDSLGHSIGDALLVQVAKRLASRLRPSDTIARLGGDDFAVLLDAVSEPTDAAAAARRVLASLEEPIAVGGREIFVSASVGIAVGSSDAETLLRDADLAMYRAKAGGRGRYEAFEQEMHTEIVERLELEVDLKRAIDKGELALAYQPIFSLRTGVISGLEALVRWRHPTRGLLPPNRFIPLAESSGRIHELGRWVLASACHQGALWRAKYPALPGIQIGVNVSGAQLRDPELVGQVSRALESAGLEPEGLTIEVTETELMEDLEVVARRLAELKELGVEIAVDDFGTGHSSLRYLQRLPLDNLKVAKPFVDEIDAPDPKPPILRAVLDLADVFDLRPVAEGIERPEQVTRLLELGCDLGQGHLLSRPVPAAEADELILNVGLLGGPVQSGAPEVSRWPSSEGPAGAS